jgi:hypothetical protein
MRPCLPSPKHLGQAGRPGDGGGSGPSARSRFGEERGDQSSFIPAAGDHGLWLWRNVQSCDRDVAPHRREVGDHGLCPWGSIFLMKRNI